LRVAAEGLLRSDDAQRRFDLLTQVRNPASQELGEPGLAGKQAQRDRCQRILR